MANPTAISPSELKALLDGPNPPRLIDVREPAEWVGPLGHIAGAELIPLGTVGASLDKVRGESREIVSICKMGGRAMQAAQLWAQQGLTVRVLQGGMTAWNGEKLPTTREP
ncbi:MAG: Hydroxyacylglutathione hydrolase [bacterium]|nr:Hydroxyacylglutathione hydrolase [bacterium]